MIRAGPADTTTIRKPQERAASLSTLGLYISEELWTSCMAFKEHDDGCCEKGAGCLHRAIEKSTMSTRNTVLGEFKETHGSEQQHHDTQAAFRVS